jgi:CRISPR/Cas system-associated exonuclease Cas4 (RecB family)
MALLSSTSKEYYNSCGYFYKLKYKDRLQPTIRINTRPFLEGAGLHNTLEISYGIKKPLDKQITISVFERAWLKAVMDQKRQGQVIFNKGESFDTLKKKTYGMVLNTIDYISFLGIDKTEFYNEYEVGSYDKPFKLAEGLEVHGKADHVQVLEDHVRVFDYKTSKGKEYLKPAQLILYALVVEKKLNKPVKETAFLMLQHNQKLNVWPTSENKKRVLDEFLEVAHKIDDGVFEPKPSVELCGKCVFRTQCQHSAIKTGPQIFSLGEITL